MFKVQKLCDRKLSSHRPRRRHEQSSSSSYWFFRVPPNIYIYFKEKVNLLFFQTMIINPPGRTEPPGGPNPAWELYV